MLHGFDVIQMPAERRQEAQRIVEELLSVNSASDLRWYVTHGKDDEMACSWGSQDKNLFWVTRSEVHIRRSDALRRPSRPTDWEGRDGTLVGWSLPGSEGGSGGGTRSKPIAKVKCPATGILQSATEPCDFCEVVHEAQATD